MITVEQARNLVLENAGAMNLEQADLQQAHGRFLAEAVTAPWDHPFFDHSAVDGFAFRFPRDKERSPLHLKLKGQVQAGESSNDPTGEDEAVRIFTGAPIPPGCDTVVMQEAVQSMNGRAVFSIEGLEKGANIRAKGEQLKKGTLALEPGTEINSGVVGLLATIGVRKVLVSARPRVGVIVTGNEFLAEGEMPTGGKIFESNGRMLQTLLAPMGIAPEYRICPDDPQLLLNQIKEFESAGIHLLLITGGASVGEFDFTKQALEQNGHRVVFHKVNQKPGKPLLFSRSAVSCAFGLPGNPRAVIMCFMQYVQPWLRATMGAAQPVKPQLKLPLAEPWRKKDDKTHFVTVNLKGDAIVITPGQASHMLQNFAGAFGIAEMESGKQNFEAGSLVKVYPL